MSLVTGERFVRVPDGQSVRFVDSDQKLCPAGEAIIDKVRGVLAFLGHVISCQRNEMTTLRDYELQVRIVDAAKINSRLDGLNTDIKTILEQKARLESEIDLQSKDFTRKISTLKTEKSKLQDQLQIFKNRAEKDSTVQFVNQKSLHAHSSLTEEETIHIEIKAIEVKILDLEEQKLTMVRKLKGDIELLDAAQKNKQGELGALVFESQIRSIVVSDPLSKKML